MTPLSPSAMRRCCWHLAAGALAASAAAAAQATPVTPEAPPGPWRVVIVQGSDPAQPAVRAQDPALRQALQAGLPRGVTYFTDALDTLRFNHADLAPEYLALARKKYAGLQVDLVVGMGDRALDFIALHRAELWPGAKLVLFSMDDDAVDRARIPADAAYLPWRLDIEGTLALIEAVQPKARRLVVVGGVMEVDRKLSARVAGLARARSRWQVDVWADQTLEELRTRLAALDAGSAVFFTTLYRDASGRPMFPLDALTRLAETTRAPIYGLFGTYLGHGMAAGRVVDFDASGRGAAALGVALLNGQPVPAVTAARVLESGCVADYRQLSAHGLAASALPAGCELHHPPRNFWTDYRGLVLAALAVLTLQGLTITALLVQRQRRRTAEAEAATRRLELGRAVRFAAMGELTASIAHEINQPLGAILSNADAAELLLRKGTATPGQLREILADIRRDDLRAHEIIRRLRGLLEKKEVEHVEFEVQPVLDDVLGLLEPEARRRGVVIERHFAATCGRLRGDAVQLQQVLLNLAINAMDAMQGTEATARRLLIGTADGDADLLIRVADRGTGIDPSRRETVFDSFYTTKPRGLGLGLPIVRAIVEAHEGRIDITAREGGGTVFTVTLPRRLGRTGPAAEGAG